MLNHYLVLAVKVLLRRKFFTFISLFGISFTLLVLTVVDGAVRPRASAPGAEEPRQDRTLYVERAVMYGPHSTWSSNGRLQAVRQLRPQPARRRAAVALRERHGPCTRTSTAGRSSSALKRTDDEFWRILDFTFLEGGPFGTADVAEARFVAVINAHDARSASSAAGRRVGQTLEADGQRFRVVGVVEDVSEMRSVPYADIWVPYTTAKTDAYKREIMGDWNAMALAQGPGGDGRHPRGVQLAAAPRRAAGPKDYKAIVAPFETKFDGFARDDADSPTARIPKARCWKLVGAARSSSALLFVAAADRQPGEHQHQPDHGAGLGDRRAQGVRRAVAHAGRTVPRREHPPDADRRRRRLRAVDLRAARPSTQSGLFSYAHFTINPRVFAYGMVLAVVFGLISGRLSGVADVAAQSRRRRSREASR